MRRLILATATASIAAGSFALAAATAIGSIEPNRSTGTVTQVANTLRSNASASVVDPKVTVHPRRALFDVRLSPGDVEYRTVTITNDGDAPTRLALTAVQTAWSGHPENPEHLRFAIARQADTACTVASHPAAPWVPLNEVTAIDHGQLEPHESGRYCAAVMLPADTTLPGDAHSDVDFLLDSIAGPPAGSESHRELAFTGAELSSLLLVAFGLLAMGVTVLLVRGHSGTGNASTPAQSSSKLLPL